jgi:hypothetical protein
MNTNQYLVLWKQTAPGKQLTLSVCGSATASMYQTSSGPYQESSTFEQPPNNTEASKLQSVTLKRSSSAWAGEAGAGQQSSATPTVVALSIQPGEISRVEGTVAQLAATRAAHLTGGSITASSTSLPAASPVRTSSLFDINCTAVFDKLLTGFSGTQTHASNACFHISHLA